MEVTSGKAKKENAKVIGIISNIQQSTDAYVRKKSKMFHFLMVVSDVTSASGVTPVLPY